MVSLLRLREYSIEVGSVVSWYTNAFYIYQAECIVVVVVHLVLVGGSHKDMFVINYD